MKKIDYMTSGTCSREILIALDDDDRIESIEIIGGCNGNLQGISRLLTGMSKDEAISKLRGIRCGSKQTSCPDQIARALAGAEKTGTEN